MEDNISCLEPFNSHFFLIPRFYNFLKKYPLHQQNKDNVNQINRRGYVKMSFTSENLNLKNIYKIRQQT